jgi:hypothetical protein
MAPGRSGARGERELSPQIALMLGEGERLFGAADLFEKHIRTRGRARNCGCCGGAGGGECENVFRRAH